MKWSQIEGGYGVVNVAEGVEGTCSRAEGEERNGAWW